MVLFGSTVSIYADEWPDWRGPNRDGTWKETGIVKKFDSNKIQAKWRVPISSGYSGPTVADGLVYITDRIEEPEEMERILCFDAMSGEKKWSYSYPCEYDDIGYRAGPRASVILDDDRAYSLGAMGHLHCIQSKTGEVIWSKDLKKEYQIRMPIWGIAAAPIIFNDKVILQIGGENDACIIALNKRTGDEIWRNLEDDASYSAPILIKQGNKPVVVFWTGRNVVGLNPNTGAVYWQEKFEPGEMIQGIASPVFVNNYLLVSGFFDGSLLLQLDKSKPTAKKVWMRRGKNEKRTDALHSCISTPLIRGNYIYGVDSYGELRCLDLLTGDRIWEDLSAVTKARWANIHLIQNGDLTYMFNEHGELIIAKLSPEGFHEMSRAKLIEPTTRQNKRGVTWAHPAFAYKHIYIRNDEELICADLTDK
jgi:outer membrane protein assembly factor BamB